MKKRDGAADEIELVERGDRKNRARGSKKRARHASDSKTAMQLDEKGQVA
jgi:hypothetical protein